MPLGLAQFSQSQVSCDRILKFFDSEEMEDYVDHTEGEAGEVLAMRGVNMSWVKDEVTASGEGDVDSSKLLKDSNRSVRTLNDVTLSIKKGSLVAVVGPVGCGKSSLLNGFLGELILKEGQIKAAGSIGKS
jgi:ABC-type bacteriocin/lantibiotic exporter with double-glycine peptidase domain